jgi:CheY-like chemotaxis protein
MSVILFVDDEPDTLGTFQKAVELFGHQAILANTGVEAFALAVEASPDMIFIDMQLADTNGLDIITQLRQNELTASTPVFVLSARAEVDCAERAREAGAQGYLCKPIRLQTLLDVIDGQFAGTPG